MSEANHHADASGSKDDAVKKSADQGGPDLALLRARLGRMLGRSSPISEQELHAANLALVAAIKARDPVRHFAEQRANRPDAMRPLLLSHLASAWAQDDQGLATA